ELCAGAPPRVAAIPRCASHGRAARSNKDRVRQGVADRAGTGVPDSRHVDGRRRRSCDGCERHTVGQATRYARRGEQVRSAGGSLLRTSNMLTGMLLRFVHRLYVHFLSKLLPARVAMWVAQLAWDTGD